MRYRHELILESYPVNTDRIFQKSQAFGWSIPIDAQEMVGPEEDGAEDLLSTKYACFSSNKGIAYTCSFRYLKKNCQKDTSTNKAEMVLINCELDCIVKHLGCEKKYYWVCV